MLIDLKKVSLFQGLSEEELNRVRAHLRERFFEKEELLFQEGANPEQIHIVKAGRVKLYRMSTSGREQILEVLVPGDLCETNPGSKNWESPEAAQAMTECETWLLSTYDYVSLVEMNSRVAHNLNRLFAQRLQRLSALLEEVSLKDVKTRVAKFLLDMLAEKRNGTGRNDVLFIPFTREEVAHRLGAARETVARQLHSLKRKRLIDIKPYQIVIRDKEGLERILGSGHDDRTK